MQPSDQEPIEELMKESSDELSKTSPQPGLEARSLPEDLEQPAPSAKYIVQPGVSYPPPPAYYENMQDQPEKLSLPVLQPRPPQPLWTSQTSGSEAWQQHPLPSPYQPAAKPHTGHYGTPVAGYPPSSPYRSMPRTRRRLNKWAWLVVAVASFLLLSSCALVIWSFSTLVTPSVQQLLNGVQTVNNYCDALQAKNYVAAYRILALQGKQRDITEAEFVKQAQAQDKQHGPVLSYSVGQPAIISNTGDTGTDVNEFTVTVSITRAKQSYDMNLDVKKFGGGWKIVGYDQL